MPTVRPNGYSGDTGSGFWGDGGIAASVDSDVNSWGSFHTEDPQFVIDDTRSVVYTWASQSVASATLYVKYSIDLYATTIDFPLWASSNAEARFDLSLDGGSSWDTGFVIESVMGSSGSWSVTEISVPLTGLSGNNLSNLRVGIFLVAEGDIYANPDPPPDSIKTEAQATAGLYDIRVEYTAPAPPTISNVSPTGCYVGNTITVTGTNFTGVTAVEWAGTGSGGVASYTVDSPTQITITAAATDSGGTVKVTTGDGNVTSTQSVTITKKPTITSGSNYNNRTIGYNGYTDGTNFFNWAGSDCVTMVEFSTDGGTTWVEASSHSASSTTRVSAPIPGGADMAGTTTRIRVTNPSGTSDPWSSFTLLHPTATAADHSYYGPGHTINFTGSNWSVAGDHLEDDSLGAGFFTAAVTNGQWTIGGSSPAAGGYYQFKVRDSSGQASTVAIPFVVLGIPTTTSLSSSTAYAGDSITVTGSWLYPLQGPTGGGTWPVVWRGIEQPLISESWTLGVTSGSRTFTAVSDTTTQTTTLICYNDYPASMLGTLNFTVYVPHTNDSLSPNSGTVGTTVNVYGTRYLRGLSYIDLPGYGFLYTFTVHDDGHISFVVPSGMSSGYLRAYNLDDHGTGDAYFTMSSAPVVSNVSPGSGRNAQTGIVITGSGFTSATSIKFNGVSATSWSIDSDTQITATVPAAPYAAPGNNLTVTSPGGTGSYSFTVLRPSFSSCAPVSSVAGAGTQVDFTGNNLLTGVSFVRWSGAGSNDQYTFSVLNNTTIRLNVPTGLAAGAYTVTPYNLAGETLGGTSHTLTGGGGGVPPQKKIALNNRI